MVAARRQYSSFQCVLPAGPAWSALCLKWRARHNALALRCVILISAEEQVVTLLLSNIFVHPNHSAAVNSLRWRRTMAQHPMCQKGCQGGAGPFKILHFEYHRAWKVEVESGVKVDGPKTDWILVLRQSSGGSKVEGRQFPNGVRPFKPLSLFTRIGWTGWDNKEDNFQNKNVKQKKKILTFNNGCFLDTY